MLNSHPIDPAHYRQVIETSVPGFRVDRIEPLTPGWDSLVFLVNDEWIFRFPTRPVVVETLQREIALLPIIAGRTKIPVPRFEVVAHDSGENPSQFVGYYALPGKPLDHVWDRSDASAKSRIAGQIGHFLRDLHGTPLHHGYAAGLEPYDPDRWVANRVQLINGAADLITSELSRTAWDRISNRIHDLLDRINWQAINPVLAHGDHVPEHILIDVDSDDQVSIIDFGDMEIGDPAPDFAGLPDDIIPEVVNAYGRDLGPDFSLRCELYEALVPFYALQAGQELNRPDLIVEGVARIRASLTTRESGGK